MKRGFALITVLWLVLILGLFAVGIAEVARRDGRGLRALEQAAKAELLLETALEQAVWALRSASPALPDLKPNALITELDAPSGARLFVRMVPAWGLVDLNSASPAVLARLAQTLRPDPEQAAELATQIAGRQGRLDAVDALSLKSANELARLRSLATVVSANRAPTAADAPVEVLALMPGLTSDDVDRVLEARRNRVAVPIPAAPGWAPEPSELRPTLPVYHITIGAVDAGGLRRGLGVALVLPLPETRPRQPYHLLDRWTVPPQDGIFALIEEPE